MRVSTVYVFAQPSFEEVLAQVSQGREQSRPLGIIRARWNVADSSTTFCATAHQTAHVRRAYSEECQSEANSERPPAEPTGVPFQVQAGFSITELKHLRRRMARLYHPDCAPNANLKAATEQMASINRLIDDALTKAKCASLRQ